MFVLMVYKNQKYRSLEIEQKIFFSKLISENQNFLHMHIFRKCSTFRRSITLSLVLDFQIFTKSDGVQNFLIKKEGLVK